MTAGYADDFPPEDSKCHGKETDRPDAWESPYRCPTVSRSTPLTGKAAFSPLTGFGGASADNQVELGSVAIWTRSYEFIAAPSNSIPLFILPNVISS
jgi:hypothetical protein